MKQNQETDVAWQVGRLLAIVGSLWGTLAGSLFLVFWHLANAGQDYFSSHMPLGMVLADYGIGFLFLVFLIVVFAASGVMAFRSSSSTTPRRRSSLQIFLLGILITALSILSGFSIGGYTIWGAATLLLGAIILVGAAVLRPRRGRAG